MIEILILNIYIIMINLFKDEIFNILKNKYCIYYFKMMFMFKKNYNLL